MGSRCAQSFGSMVAEVAEVSLADGKVKVHRVVCAVDCGMTVNPEIVRRQMESAILFGLSAALYGKITIKGGRVEQSNFHDYPVATHERDAAGRSAYRAKRREAQRRRRTGHAAHRSGGMQRALRADGQAHPQFADLSLIGDS